MTHTVTGKLNKPAREFPGDNGSMFAIDLGERNYNRKTKQQEWTNYGAAVFAKDNQAQYYRDALVEGAIVSVTGSGLIVDNFTGQDQVTRTRLNIQDAKIVYVDNPNRIQQAPQQRQPAPQQRPVQQPAPQQMDDFDNSDIPF